MYWYYEILRAAVLTDLRGFMLILCVHLGTVNRHFELFKTVALLACIFSKNCAWYSVEKIFCDQTASAYSLHKFRHSTDDVLV